MTERSGPDAGTAQTTAVTSVRGPLSFSNRPVLSTCVDRAGGGEITALEVADVQRALDSIRASLNNRSNSGEPVAVEGCPPPTALSGAPPADAVERRDALHRAVKFDDWDAVSEHSVFVYFVPSDVHAAHFGADPFKVGSAEMRCESHQCWAVTTSLYVPAGTTPETLELGLLGALGIGNRAPQPTIDWSPCERGTPEPRCDRYEDFAPRDQPAP